MAASDQAARAEVGQRFAEGVRTAARAKESMQRRAAATLLGAMGANVRGIEPGDLGGIARILTPELVTLARDPDPAVREAAVRALGRLNPDPDLAARALAKALGEKDPTLRRAAAAALGDLMETVVSLFGRGRVQTGVEATQQEVGRTGAAVVPPAAQGSADSDAQVRRLCLEALRRAAEALRRVMPEPADEQNLPPPGNTELTTRQRQMVDQLVQHLRAQQDFVRPLVEALAKHGPAVGPALADSDASVRLAASQAVEAIGGARLRMLRYAASLAALHSEKTGPEDPLRPVVKATVPGLAKTLAHNEVRVRLAALYALENLEGEAAPALDELLTAQKDANDFVRWGVVRVLGRMAPKEAARTVPALAQALGDDNGNVRMTALVALERYGPAAAPAVEALAKRLQQGTSEERLGVLRTLAALGTKASPAVKALAGALSAAQPEVRAAAARTLARLGPAARPAEDALRRALSDPEPPVRLEASEALLAIPAESP
jgi:HEAT repeat protein